MKAFIDFIDERGIGNEVMRSAAGSKRGVIVLDWQDVATWHLDFAEFILDRPDEAMEAWTRAAESIVGHEFVMNAPRFAIRNLSVLNDRVDIGDLRAEHAFRYIQIDGAAKSVFTSEPRLVKAVYKCNCEHEMDRWPVDGMMNPPKHCDPYTLEGCEKTNRQTSFRLLKEKSTYQDVQRIRLHQIPDGDSKQTRTEEIFVEVADDLIDIVTPGDAISVFGVIRMVQKGKGSDAMTMFFEAHHIEVADAMMDVDGMTTKQIERIHEMSRDPDILDSIAQSIAPSVHGMTLAKKGVALQLFGGRTVKRPDMTVRSEINILLIGDPGTAKSQLLQAAVRFLPRSTYVVGPNATGVGLTAHCRAVDAKMGGGYEVEAGAMPLCDGGLIAIDEITRLKESEQNTILATMEQQFVKITKANIDVMLQARVSTLASGNPIKGRFSPYEPYPKQIDIIPPLLDRFDAVFPIVTNTKDDKALSSHMWYVRESANETAGGEEHNPDIDPIYNLAEMRAYIMYAREKVAPRTCKEAQEAITSWWMERRATTGEDGRIPASARMKEGLMRFSEACARSRLSNVVTLEDAETAISLVSDQTDLYTQGEMVSVLALNRGDTKKDGLVDDAAVLNAIDALAKHPEYENYPGWDISDIKYITNGKWDHIQNTLALLVKRGFIEVVGEKRSEQGHYRYRRTRQTSLDQTEPNSSIAE